MNVRNLTPFILLLAAACSENDRDISAQIQAQFDASRTAPIDLSLVGPPSCERVCVLPPYTLNDQAKEILGFEWNSNHKTSIGGDDGINVLAFVQGTNVVAFTEYRRDKGDFSSMNPKCLAKENAIVFRQVAPDPRSNGWVYLVAKP
jgi:hypothetical protein